jgi:hypothetical protein
MYRKAENHRYTGHGKLANEITERFAKNVHICGQVAQ